MVRHRFLAPAFRRFESCYPSKMLKYKITSVFTVLVAYFLAGIIVYDMFINVLNGWDYVGVVTMFFVSLSILTYSGNQKRRKAEL